MSRLRPFGLKTAALALAIGGTIAFAPKTAIAQLTPTEGQIISGNTIVFNWPANTFIAEPRYRLAVGTLPSMADAKYFPSADATENTVFNVSGFPNNGTTYYWRIFTVNPRYDEIDSTPIYSFQNGTRSTICTPTLNTPADAAAVTLPTVFNFSFFGNDCGPQRAILFSDSPAFTSGSTRYRLLNNSSANYTLAGGEFSTLPFNEGEPFFWTVASGEVVGGRFSIAGMAEPQLVQVGGGSPNLSFDRDSLTVRVLGGSLNRSEAARAQRPAGVDFAEKLAATDADPYYLYVDGKRLRLEPSPTKAMVRFAPGADADAVLSEISAQTRSATAPTFLGMHRRWDVAMVELPGGMPTRGAEGLKGHAISWSAPVMKLGDRELGISDRIIVRFANSLSKQQILAIAEANGLEEMPTKMARVARLFRLAEDSAEDALRLSNRFVEEGIAEFAQPDFYVEAKTGNFTDPLARDQWHLRSTGQLGAVAGADANVVPAWDHTLGEDVRVAISDTGFDLLHKDIKYMGGFDTLDFDEDPSADPALDSFPGYEENHGTSVAGVSSARGNTIGGLGAAPRSSVIPIRNIVPPFSTAEGFAASFVVTADYGAELSNNSWGFTPFNPDFCSDADDFFLAPLTPAESASLSYAANTGRGGRGMPIIFCAMNDRSLVSGMGYQSSPLTLTVTATNNVNRRSHYSNYGPEADIAAPSNDFARPDLACEARIWTGGTLGITTADRTGAVGYNPVQQYPDDYTDYAFTRSFGGTSSAAPLVTGVAALVLSVSPELMRDEVYNILTSTATKIDTANGRYDANGHSIFYGYGKVNAEAAVLKAMETGPYQRRRVTITNTGSAPLFIRDTFVNGGSPWVVELEPKSFVLPAGKSLDLRVDVDARRAEFGNSADQIVFVTNDPQTPQLALPISLERRSAGSQGYAVVEALLGRAIDPTVTLPSGTVDSSAVTRAEN